MERKNECKSRQQTIKEIKKASTSTERNIRMQYQGCPDTITKSHAISDIAMLHDIIYGGRVLRMILETVDDTLCG